jgi:hypothetical protein
LLRELLIASERVEQWQHEVLEILDDLVKTVRKSSLTNLFHEGIPLNSMAFNETSRECLKLPVRYSCLPILKRSVDRLEKSS